MKANGFILPTVLIFLLIFSLLGLYGLTKASQMTKLLSHLQQHDENLRRVDGAFIELANNDIPPDCMIPTMLIATLAKLPLSWWQNSACHATFQQASYDYTVELLGIDPCAQISANLVAKYYRISLRIANLKAQGIVIKPQPTLNLACQEQPHMVSAGRQSWREI